MSVKDFLCCYESWAKATHKASYSRRNLARKAGIRSPNFLGLVISGQRRLSSSWLQGLSKAIGLSSKETQYLTLLDKLNHNSSHKSQIQILQQLEDILSEVKDKNQINNNWKILKNPLAWDLLEMIELKDHSALPVWFKKRLRKSHSAPEISQSLKLLEELEFIKKTQNSTYTKSEKHFQTPDQLKSAENAFFHEHVLNEALEVLHEISPQDRNFGSLTIALHEDQINDFKQEVNRFGKLLIKRYGEHKQSPNEVYRINIQLYPVTIQQKTSGERKSK